MAGGAAAQLKCSIWRHYLNHKRQWPWLLGIVVVAVFPFALLAGFKSSVPAQVQNACYFKSRTISSQWPVSMLQSFVCNLPNECQDEPGDDNAVDSYPGALINSLIESDGITSGKSEDMKQGLFSPLMTIPKSLSLLSNLTQLLTHPNLTDLMENGLRIRDVIRSPEEMTSILVNQFQFDLKVVNAIMMSTIDMSRVISLVGYRDISTLICKPDQLSQFLVSPTQDEITNISTSLCDLPSDRVTNISRTFVSQLDANNLFEKVSHVLDAIGGYEAEGLVSDVGGLLASLGSLESLAPLASILDSLTTAVNPLISAMSELYDAGWDSQSVTSLLTLVEDLMDPAESSPTSARLHDTRDVRLLLSPENLTSLDPEEYNSDAWTNVLSAAVTAVNNTGMQLSLITQEVEKIPELHTVFMLATSVLPVLIGPDSQNMTRLAESLNTAIDRMVPDVNSEILKLIPVVHGALFVMAGNIKITTYAAIWVKDLPSSIIWNVFHAFSNVTLMKTIIMEDRIVDWTCSRDSWPDMTEADWITFENRLCSEENIGNLYEIQSVFQITKDPSKFHVNLDSNSKANVSIIFEDVKEIIEAITNATEIFNGQDENKRKRRSILDSASDLLGELPPSDVQTIRRVEYGIIEVKYFIRNITKMYITAVNSTLKLNEYEGKIDLEHVPDEIKFFLQTQSVSDIADVVGAILDTVIEVMRGISPERSLSGATRLQDLSNVLYRVLPNNTYEGVSATLRMMDSPTITMPAPIPQILGVLGAVKDILIDIQQKDSVVEWMKENVPKTAYLIMNMKIMPRISALPYLLALNGITPETLELLGNDTLWRQFPCGTASLTSFYPNASGILPASWEDIETIKNDIRTFEVYLCQNGADIMTELSEFSPELAESVRNIVENMVPVEVNVPASVQMLKELATALSQLNLEVILENLYETYGLPLLEVFMKSFGPIAETNSDEPNRIVMNAVDTAFYWLSHYPSTQELFRQLQFFMYHGIAMDRAVIQLLSDEPTLAKLIGLPSDYAPIVLLQKDPQGTANFILQEMSDLSLSVITDNPIDWSAWASSMCNRSINQSSLVSLACYFLSQPQLPELQSSLTNTVITGISAYENRDLEVPFVGTKDVMGVVSEIINTFQHFNLSSFSDLNFMDTLWGQIVQESHIFVQGLEQLQQHWPFMMIDTLAGQIEQFKEVLVKMNIVVDWLQTKIPSNLENLSSDLPPSLKSINKALNESWIDLLDGIHYNLNLDPGLINLTLTEICSKASSSDFQDPVNGGGQFNAIMREMCSLFLSFNIGEFDSWLGYNQLIADIHNNNGSTFSSKELLGNIEFMVNQRINIFQNITENDLLDTFAQSFPSYLQKDKWNDLIQRVGTRQPNDTLSSITTTVETVLQWISPQDEALKTNLMRMATLQNSFAEALLADDLSQMFRKYRTLKTIHALVTYTMPYALKDLAGMVSKRPQEVGQLVKDWQVNGTIMNTLCQMNLQSVGQNFQAAVTQMCFIQPDQIFYDLGQIVNIEIFNNDWTPDLQSIMTMNIESGDQLLEQIGNGSFSPKFHDPGIYLGLELWRELPSLVFNVTSDTMWDNSTMVLSVLLEPLISFSSSETEEGRAVIEMLKSLAQSLRTTRLSLALLRGGDLWKSLKEAYVDKPLVINFLDIVESFPQFVVEYLNFFGNVSTIAQGLLFKSDTICNWHLFFIDGNREHISLNGSAILTSVIEFLCNYEQMDLLPQQLVPTSAPMIANTSMELDAAMLAMLIDDVALDFMFMIEGDFYEGLIQIPTWAEEAGTTWETAYERLRNFLDLSPQDLVTLVTGSLDATRSYLGDEYILPAVSVAYQLSKRISDSINETTGIMDIDRLFVGMGNLSDYEKDVMSILPEILAFGSWFQESRLYFNLVSRHEPSQLYNQMCSEGVDQWLHHPYLNDDQWETTQRVICPQNEITINDFSVLMSSSEIMNGMAINWMKIVESIEDMASKLPAIRPNKMFPQHFKNIYWDSLQNLTISQRVMHGILSGTWAMQQHLISGTEGERHQMALVYINIIEVLRPIASHDEPFFRRISDLDSFKILIQEYANVMEGIVNGTNSLNHKYRVNMSPALVPGVSVEGVFDAHSSTRGNSSHFELQMEFRETLLNLSKVLFPDEGDGSPPLRPGEFFENITRNIMESMPDIVQVGRAPVCEYLSGEQWAFTVQARSKDLILMTKHINQIDSYMAFTCQLPDLNLTHALNILMEDYGWKTDIQQMMTDDQVLDPELNCDFMFKHLKIMQDQITSVMGRFIKNETAQEEMMSCMSRAAHSTTGLQLRGILSAVGGLFEAGAEDKSGINVALTDVMSIIPGASASLKTLSTRISVMVPLIDVLNSNFEETMNLSTEALNIIKNDVWADVNRIQDVDWMTFSKLLKSKEEMTKVLQIKNGEMSSSNIVKRQVSPIDTLFEAINAMGPEQFSQMLLTSVNETYLSNEIDNMRMDALISSEWLMPIMEHMNAAVKTLSKLSNLEAVMDLNKIIAGEVDPVSFLTQSVQLMQIKLWTDLAESFSSILETTVPVITGSELSEDMKQVVDGINALQGVVNLANLDFTIPTTDLISNWTTMENYLREVLGIDADVIDALSGTELNLMEVLSLEDVTLEEVMCKEKIMDSVINLPKSTNVTLENIILSLCNSTNAQNLASSFLQQLDIGPLLTLFTKFGINATLSSYGMTIEQVIEALNNLRQTSGLIPEIKKALFSIRDILKKPAKLQAESEDAGEETSTSIVDEFTSQDFLDRAGQVICGHPLRLVPDSLKILKSTPEPSLLNFKNNDDVCQSLEDEINNLQGGRILLHFIKPLMKGKIYYTPKNAITDRIMEKANDTFVNVEAMRVRMKSLQDVAVMSSSNQSIHIKNLEEAFQLSWVNGMIQKMMPEEEDAEFIEEITNSSKQMQDLTSLMQEFDDILSMGVNLLSCIQLDRFVPVDNEEEMIHEAEKTVTQNQFLAGIVFKDVGITGNTETSLPKKMTYSIRVDSEKTPSTVMMGPKYWRPGPYQDMALHMRYHQGFLLLQDMIDKAILQLQYETSQIDIERHLRKSLSVKLRDNSLPSFLEHSNPTIFNRRKRSTTQTVNNLTEDEASLLLDLPVYTKQQPYPCFEKDKFMEMLSRSPVLNLILTLIAFTIFIVFLIQHLVQERKSRNKQLQEVMGMKTCLDLFVWFCYSLFVLLIVVLLLTLITKFGGIQPKVDFGVLFTLLFLYGLSIISFCYFVSCVVTSPVLAVFVGVMSTLIFNVPFITISVIQATVPLGPIIVACLLPPSAFGFGFRILCQFELLGTGASYDNLGNPPLKDSKMTLGLALIMLLVDTVLFYILALIASALRNVACCNCGSPNKVSPPEKGSLENLKKEHVRTLDVDPGVKQSLRKGLSIVGLRQIYQQRGRSKLAVDNLSLELYEGQVLALLGHNGAGKTTVISIITREIEATAGNVQVYGHDVQNSWEKARRYIGLCPQQAVLFPLMTVEETLLYYATLKGTENDKVDSEVNTILVDMGLFEHRRYIGHQLSEGLRRRLCLAIAFVGGSKLIILDEPTSGVDPAARAAMWEVISSNRGGRTILLTTHHLDEAETLADRVAILHQGRLLCIGSPLALKSEYGSGYSICLSNRIQSTDAETEKENQDRSHPKKNDFANVRFMTPNTTAVWDLIRNYVSNAKLLEAMNGEVTYSLPLLDAKGQDNRLSEMFGVLEGKLESLGFSSMEIRPTNLEDVVIALNAINNIDCNSVTQSRVTLLPEPEKQEHLKDTYNFKPRSTLEGAQLGLQRFRSILYKRLLSHGRNWVFYVQMFLLPVLFIILAMIGSIVRPIGEKMIALPLTPEMYGTSTPFIRTSNSSLAGLASALVGEEDWGSCPSKVHGYHPNALPCNSSSEIIENNCACQDELCWMDVSNQFSLNDWLVTTKGKYIQRRYGGLSLGIVDSRVEGGRTGAMVWYDNSGYHSLPAYLNKFNNARLQRLVGQDYKIKTINHPIKFSSYSFSSISVEQHVADSGIGLLILLSLTVVISATSGYVAGERVRGERRVLYVAGLNRNIYWAANMFWDFMVILINVALTSMVLLAFNQQQFLFRDNLIAFVLLCILYGLSLLPFFYLLEGMFKSEAAAVLTFFATSFAIGLITTLIVLTCRFYNWVTTMQEMENVVKYLFLAFPPFTFACAIRDLSLGYARTAILARFDMDVYVSPFTWDLKLQGGLGLHYLTLALWAVIATIILHVWRDCLGPLPQPPAPAKTLGGAEEDKDVAAERIKIQCGGASLYDTVLRMVGLGKDYSSPPSAAVSNLFLALRRGECFSLLGLNGAGKTTTFRCVTGDLRPSRGQILINGQILQEALALPRAVMGYCPQSHALDPNLTPKEALTAMAYIRGFPSSEIATVLDRVIEQMGLSDNQNTFISQLSGGTKRKVSTALALLGNPLLVLLDEPTTGLDPASRRRIWSAIKSVTQDGRTVLLTSHSMDEVNVLSHRMAIMVNGYFVCMGSPHYLKNKLGDKYTIKLKTGDIEDMSAVIDYLRSQLTDILLKEQHHLTLVVEVNRRLPLRLIFDTLNNAKGFGVTEYDVSQTTLDEVFRLLTSHQGDGQLPPPPVGNDSEQGLPMHLSNLHPAGVNLSPERTFQKQDALFNRPPSSRLTTAEADNSRMPSIEEPNTNRSSFYDNLDNNPTEIYATVGKPRPVRPSPDIESIRSDSGSAEDSPEEEWTHL